MKVVFFIIFYLLIFCFPVFAEDNISDLKKEIIVLYNTNKIREAYSLISKIPEDKRDAEIWLLAGNITQDYGKSTDAEFLFQKAISIEPKNYKAYYNLGTLYLKEEKFNSAIENYKLCIKNNKEFAYAWNNLGLSYYGLEEYSKAKSAFMRAISYKSTEADFYYNLACTYKKLKNKKQAEKMIKIYNKLKEQK